VGYELGRLRVASRVSAELGPVLFIVGVTCRNGPSPKRGLRGRGFSQDESR
jgi:hypothetical protein